MKQSVKFILLAVALVVLILLAVFGYNYLTSSYEAPEQTVNDSQSATEQINAATDFTVIDMDGNAVKLSDSFGKPIIVNFWATWCGPCESELPAFNEAYNEYGEDIIFLMVNLTDGYRDTVDNVKEYVSENEYGFPVYFDTEYNGSDAYKVSSIPLTILIDKNGNMHKSHVGAMDKATLEGYIKDLLGGGNE